MLLLSSRLAIIPLAVASAALFLMMCMTFADVVLRSSFDAPIEAATELTRILMAIVVFSQPAGLFWPGRAYIRRPV